MYPVEISVIVYPVEISVNVYPIEISVNEYPVSKSIDPLQNTCIGTMNETGVTHVSLD